MHNKTIDKLKMSLRVPMFWQLLMVLTFVHQFDAITNHDGPATGSPPHLATATLDPEELLHGVIPCTCVDIRLCPTLLNSLKHPVSASSAEIRHLQRFTCGFRGFTPFVCCNEMANTPMDRPTPPMSVVTPTPYPYVTHNPRKGTSKTFGPSNGGNSFSDPIPNIPNGDTYAPFDTSDFGPKGEPSSTATQSDYDPTEDIAKTFLPPAVGSQSMPNPSTPRGHYDPTDDTMKTYNTRPGLGSITTPSPYIPIEDTGNTFVSPGTSLDSNQYPTTPLSQYDPTDDIASTFGTGPGVGLVSITTPSPYVPIEDIDSTFVTPGTGQHPSTPSSHYDPTDDIASTFGIRPDVETTNNPPILPESSPYDPKLDDANAFDGPGVQPHGFSDKTSSTNNPTKDILDVNGSPNIYSNNNPLTSPSPYDHTDDSTIPVSTRPGVDTSNDPSTVSYPYDPTDDIAKTFGSPTIHSNNNPSTEPNIYDLTDDISKTSGTRPDLINTEQPSYYDSRDNTGHTYGSPGKTDTQVPTINTVGPLMPNQHRPMTPFTLHLGPHKNLTEFKFHLETKDPSGNITIHLNRLPFQGNRKSYNVPTVTEMPPVTVNYNLQFQPTNMEKKYLQFKDLFYKNLNASKGYPDMKSNNNFYHPYYGNKLLITSPQFRVNQDRRYEKPIPNADNPYVLHYLLRAPRSTSTHRYVRQYDPADYYRFTSRLYYPHFSATTHPHFPISANHPYFAASSSKKESSTYPELNYKPTPDQDYDYPDDEPVTAKPNQYGHHHIADRGVVSGWGNEGHTPPRRKPVHNDGAIVFPDDSDDEAPNRFQHYQPHPNNAYYPGHSFGSRHPAWRPHYPQWGFNHGQYHNPGYHNHNSDFDSDDTTTAKTFITVTTLPPAAAPSTVSAAATVIPPVTEPTTTPTTPPTPMVASLTSVVGNTTAAVAGSELITKIAVGPEGRQATRQLLPGDACGVSVDERIIGGKAAALGAYPWIARIGYLRNGTERVLYRCAGTLINSIYVITAAHCISNLPAGLTLAAVRLGEVDEAQDPDCRGSECADPVQDFAPAQITVHTGYDTPQFKNDVGLIRLDRPARVSTYVSPICLPLDLLSSKNYTGLKATAAGWGASNVGAPSANPILQWVRLTVAPLAQCAATFATRSGVSVGVGQLCAGGERGRDSCEGDSGGPLMRPEQPDPENSPRYFLIGIVSFGAKRCGSDNMPGVYTNVGSYVDWILDNILE